ncbi:predicted protein [Streptomyces viridochromogenes DSM 40736]|uniref:Predicted protein n=1 Tax=Streptomyces viridochromogenes (strain DSM 40736 / JCM 4977 / BCRC 1201 / Tue 494) TaxID=591159 RepID=D9XA01_STRVT|nr:predicted protein [Streptomyces viridochromogenes DSM 40736]
MSSLPQPDPVHLPLPAEVDGAPAGRGHGPGAVAQTPTPVFPVARHVDGASGGGAVILRQELEEGPGAVEGVGLGRAGDREPWARMEFVALRAERSPARPDVDDDVTGPGGSPGDRDRTVAGCSGRRRNCRVPGTSR